MGIYLGYDIGGTKCRVSIGKEKGPGVSLLGVGPQRLTAGVEPLRMIAMLSQDAEALLKGYPKENVVACGVSCGSPMDRKRGLIQAPPNLPTWIDVPVGETLEKRFHAPCYLLNDARAGAWAETLLGAGKGFKNVIFLTMGTGLGAGIVANGHLVLGGSDNAGEIGHIRLKDEGPFRNGKAGSFEGFCGGNGIGDLGQEMTMKALREGRLTSLAKTPDEIQNINAKSIALAAQEGDSLAKEIYALVGTRLGEGLAILIDVLNPDVIVIGSVFVRAESLLRPTMEKALKKEALPSSYQHVKIVPSALGESIGDIAALLIAHSCTIGTLPKGE